MVTPILVIGCATKDHRGLHAVVSELAAAFAVPVAVVAYGDPRSQPLASALAGAGLPVVEARDKDPIVPGAVYVAPPDYHLLVEIGHFALSTEAPVRGTRPAIDPLFESAAEAYGANAIAVLVTDDGARDDRADGMRGLARIRECGGIGFVQRIGTASRQSSGGIA